MLRRLIADWEDIKAPRVTEIPREDYGYSGSVDLVRKRLAQLRPSTERVAQPTGYRPGQVPQVDWGEMPTRPRIADRERRVYALVFSLMHPRRAPGARPPSAGSHTASAPGPPRRARRPL